MSLCRTGDHVSNISKVALKTGKNWCKHHLALICYTVSMTFLNSESVNSVVWVCRFYFFRRGAVSYVSFSQFSVCCVTKNT